MIRVERVANRQLLFILTLMRGALPLASLPVITSGQALQDAWLSAILVAILSVPLMLIASGLGSKHPKMTGVEYGRKLLGGFGGTIISLIFLYLLLDIAGTDTRVYANAMSTITIQHTPIHFIVGAMAVLAGLAAYGGIEGIGRSADILFPLFALFVVLCAVFALPGFNACHLEPVLARGIEPVLTSVPVPLAISAQFVVLTILLPTSNAPEKVTRTAILSMALVGVQALISTIMVIGTLGPFLASEGSFPFFAMTRSATFGVVFDRLEAPALLAWGLALFIAVSTYTYCAARTLGEILGLRDYRAIVGPLTALWAVYSVQGYRDAFEMGRVFSPAVVVPHTSIQYLLPFTVLWAAYIVRTYIVGRGNGGGRNDAA